MDQGSQSSREGNSSQRTSNPKSDFVSAPSISLPKGGGAIKGISEKFAANPITGTASFTIPLPVSPARGFEPQLGLNYDSGAGNGPFGLGWSLGVPGIGRKTEKGLPQYLDADNADTYTLDGFEDLLPLLKANGENWEGISAEKILAGIQWEVTLYRPRIEAAFSKIERWRNPASGIIWWRTTTSANITSVYGYNPSARIADPEHPEKTFKWFIDCSYDDHGHFCQYLYKPEDLIGVDHGLSYEMHRKGQAVAQSYLKRVLYGIKQPYWLLYPEVNDVLEKPFGEDDFYFQTVLDYGEHVELEPTAAETATWEVRPDPFSSYRAGFEIRTYRRCKRVLLFHQFEQELPTKSEPISAISFDYDNQTEGFSFLTKITRSGNKRDQNGILQSKSLPSMDFEYQSHAWNTEIKTLDSQSLQNLPGGIDGKLYQWLDLYSEGLSGVLTEQAGGLYYKQNLGGAVFAAAKLIAPSPSLHGFAGGWQIQDLESNGSLSLVSVTGPVKGFYKIDDQSAWQNFQAFSDMPNIDFRDPKLRILDLDGDGRPDLLLSEERAFRWYPSAGEQGFGKARMSAKAQDEDSAPAMVFTDATESIFLADMSGDGLQDIVRIRNSSVVYWPNLGFGQFGAKVAMGGSPKFDHPDQFNPSWIRLADLDGSGTTDIIYLGKKEFRYWLNLSGNLWSAPYATLNPFPEVDNLASVSVFDLLGSGTGCVAWSSPLPKHSRQSVKYIDLMNSTKPHLMTNYQNGMGKQVTLSYTPSTRFYLEDRANGQPWLTKLHFPVHCLAKVESFDQITKARLVSEYSYHHGYFDHAEREFRGFGRVDQIDTEEFEHFVAGGSSNVVEHSLHQPPVLTKTWFHTGYYLDRQHILSQFQYEYFAATALENFTLEEPTLPEGLTAAEWREALRACKGMALRSEVYGLDGTDQQTIPYSITQNSCDIKLIQPKANNQYAAFQTIGSESLSLQLDRNPDDPRITHNLILQTDAYGNPQLSAAVGYRRQTQDPTLPLEIQAEQAKIHIVVSQAELTRDDFGPFGDIDFFDAHDATYRLPVSWKASSYQLSGVAEPAASVFSRAELLQAFLDAQSVGFEEIEATGLVKRLLTASETRFSNDTLDGPRAAGELSPQGIGWQSYQLAFTPALLHAIYADKVDADALLGGYINVNADGNWWQPSPTPIYSADAAARFYLPLGAYDAFGNPSWVDLDAYLLLPVGSRDALQNQILAFNDYRTLSPEFVCDPNQNWVGVATDELGMVIKSAVMGKVAGLNAGDKPPPNTDCEGDNLDYPSAELSYAFYDPLTEQPSHVYRKSYVNHHAADTSEQRAEFLQQYEYSDGSGQVIMVKAQAEPGLAKRRNADGSIEEADTGTAVRWIGNGRTIRNNKGNPVKQFEPYFSITPDYEDDPALVEVGVTPILFYDAAGRNDCKLHPNHSYEKVVFNPWQQAGWDVNDTVFLQNPDGSIDLDPANDADVGHYFAGLDTQDYLPSWYGARIDGALGSDEQAAAVKTAIHTASPSVVHLDSLGRTVLTIAHNKLQRSDALPEEHFISTRVKLDIQGNQLEVIDALDRIVMHYDYNMLGKQFHSFSMEAGERWTLNDVTGKPIRAWDSRGHALRTEYDALRRPTGKFVIGSDALQSDPRVFGRELMFEKIEYGEGQVNDTALNLRTRVRKLHDTAGEVSSEAYDFKGNLLRGSRQLAGDYKAVPDWSATVALEAETFAGNTTYDALNRPVTATSPDGSVIRPAYNEASLLERLDVNLHGETQNAEPIWTPFVTDIDYNAKGQRELIAYGNGVSTAYSYDPLTFRLARLLTSRNTPAFSDDCPANPPADWPGCAVQNLSYVYDPAGNITHIRDDAQQTIYFRNQRIEPSNDYSYDAIYQLIEATGREHLGQNTDGSLKSPTAPDAFNGFHTGLLQPGDGNALGRYLESYVYDVVGNILAMQHRRSDATSPGWTRTYAYHENSLIEDGTGGAPLKVSNRLSTTTIGNGNSITESYLYDAHGSMTAMPHLPTMQWTFLDQLRASSQQVVNDGIPETTYYVYDGGGQRLRKVTEKQAAAADTPTRINERIYLGGFEVYREYGVDGQQTTLERQSLHVMDDKQRIAMVETRTLGDDGTAEQLIRYQLGNHLGSASVELDDGGRVISYEEYFPYGATSYQAVDATIRAARKRYRYTGMERDEESGFSYHGARYLAGWLGRWCSADPAGMVDGPNRYVYVRGNPISGRDPTGTQDQCPLLDVPGESTQPIVVQETTDPTGKAQPASYVETEYFALDSLEMKQANLALAASKLPDIAERAYNEGFTDYYQSPSGELPSLAGIEDAWVDPDARAYYDPLAIEAYQYALDNPLDAVALHVLPRLSDSTGNSLKEHAALIYIPHSLSDEFDLTGIDRSKQDRSHVPAEMTDLIRVDYFVGSGRPKSGGGYSVEDLPKVSDANYDAFAHSHPIIWRANGRDLNDELQPGFSYDDQYFGIGVLPYAKGSIPIGHYAVPAYLADHRQVGLTTIERVYMKWNTPTSGGLTASGAILEGIILGVEPSPYYRERH
jgi:RHS repeat-associated protein